MKNKILFVVMIVAMLVLAACGGTASTPTESPANVMPQNTPMPSTSTSGSSSAMTISKSINLDPAAASDADSKSIVADVYETLVKVDNGAPAASLATSWTVSEDGLEYTFNLQPGATFHDGSPVNADAVIANFNRWFDPKDANHGSGTYDAWVAVFKGFKGDTDASGKPKSQYDGIEKVNETTVLVHLNTPDTNFLTEIADPAFSIVSPAALSASGFGTQTGKDGGSGPYTISAWSDTGLTLAPFSGYWNQTAVPTGNMEFQFGQ